jgi:Uma2 family endonuclease
MTLERLIDVETFEQIAAQPENQGRRLELIAGEIVEKAMPTEAHGLYCGNLYTALAAFAHPRKLGRVTIETRFRRPNDPHNSLIPDISFSSAKRPLIAEGSVPDLPDLVVEIQSPDDSLKALREKMRYYLQHGTRLGLIVLPSKRLIEVYTPQMELILTENDTLTGGEVLPGFEMPVAAVFHDPLADSPADAE